MQCLILAGGLGTRMKTITGHRPKALLPIGRRAFIDWQLLWLKQLGITEIIMAIGHGGEEIRNHIEIQKENSEFPLVKYSFDGPELLGTREL